MVAVRERCPGRQPVPQRITLACGTEPCQCRQGKVRYRQPWMIPLSAGFLEIILGQLVQQLLRLSQVRRRAGHAARRARPALLQQRHDLLTEIISSVLGAQVARIIDPDQPVRLRIVHELCTAGIQKRPDQPTTAQRSRCRHADEAAHSGTAQQTKKHGLSLIVSMLGGKQHRRSTLLLTERGIARFPGFPLHAWAWLDPNAYNLQLNAQHFTDGLTVRWPTIGYGLQPVVYVDCANGRQLFTSGQASQKMQ